MVDDPPDNADVSVGPPAVRMSTMESGPGLDEKEKVKPGKVSVCQLNDIAIAGQRDYINIIYLF